jgi:hypothetical protein
MSETWCALKLANLEGWRHMEASTLHFSKPTAENIDRRARYLEQLYSIDRPPPMLPLTWDSLEYRIRRLDQRQSPSQTVCKQGDGHHMSVPSDPAVALATIRTVLASFSLPPSKPAEEVDSPPGTPLSTGTTLGPDEYPDEKKNLLAKSAATQLELSILSQYLSWAAGRHHFRAPERQETLADLYHFAVELSIMVANPAMHQPVVRPLPMPGPVNLRNNVPGGGGYPLVPNPFAERGRPNRCVVPGCPCSFHPPGAPKTPLMGGPPGHGRLFQGPGVSKPKLRNRSQESLVSKRTRGRWGFGWLRRLWCFGKKDSDADSICSSSTGSTELV